MLMSPFPGEKTEASCLLSESGHKLSSGPLPRTVPPSTRGSACSSRYNKDLGWGCGGLSHRLEAREHTRKNTAQGQSRS